MYFPGLSWKPSKNWKSAIPQIYGRHFPHWKLREDALLRAGLLGLGEAIGTDRCQIDFVGGDLGHQKGGNWEA